MKKIQAIVIFMIFILSGSAIVAGQYDLVDIELFGADIQKKIIDSGITSTEQILNKLAKKKDRIAYAKQLNVSVEDVDKWVGMCDLMRINGVGPKAVKLLVGAGVMNLGALREQEASALLAKVTKVNDEQHITEKSLDTSLLSDWIQQAKQLPIVVEY